MSSQPRWGVPAIGQPGVTLPAYSVPETVGTLPLAPFGGRVTDRPYGGSVAAMVRGGSVAATPTGGTIVRR